MRLRLVSSFALAVVVIAACGGNEKTGLQPGKHEPTPDPKLLVVQLADLPSGFSLVPGERIPVPLSRVLAEPWSVGHAALIRRERIAGYQTSFRAADLGRIESSAATYRSSDGARRVFRHGSRSFGAFLATSQSGRRTRVERIGEETRGYRYDVGRANGLTVIWRYRNVIASCTTMQTEPPDLRQLTAVAQAQQERISGALE